MIHSENSIPAPGPVIILSDVCCNYAVTDSGGKVSISSQQIKKITRITAHCSVAGGCARHPTHLCDAGGEAMKEKDLSTPLHPSMPPLLHGGVTGKTKGENRKKGIDAAGLFVAMSPSER